ncbi:efflux transporter outer membrane subunit [Phenylobacterium aquaticum]|uniref:efflux transporter outer membrane subunit n=1 Tax=Phenylobacterium aquaticum TaxID=1763816 RepID=UPI0026EDE8C2|nr:efflux transporter outer membrane subunit [Phenylobacterium aquaticum]
MRLSEMRPFTFAAQLLAAVSLSACTLAPHYERPALPVAQTWPVGQAPSSTPTASAGELGWRTVFLDPRLQGVIDLALKENRDLRVAVLNIEKARAQYRVQRAELLPSISASGGETRSHTPALVSQTGRAVDAEQYSATVGFTAYELDLFGRVRSLNQVALQSYLATEETRRATQISLVAEVASDYLTLAADQELLRIAQDTLATREESLRLSQKRFEAGATSQLDLSQAQTLTEQARADVAATTAQAGRDRNALRLVVGAEIPADLLPQSGLNAIAIQADLPAGLPSMVLTGRPDVLAAEHALEAQNANIGAARAAFLPRISLTGSTGAASPDLGSLFNAGTGSWSFTPQISLPIFSGGADLANLGVAKANRDITVAQYEKAVQTGFREVADGLETQATIRDRVAAQDRLVAAAANSQRLAQARYDKGVDSYLILLDAQRTLYGARQTQLAAKLAELNNRVTLYKALGGGVWP